MRSVSSLINEKLNSTQQTQANNANPKMSIKASRARTTVVDYSYWTVETIRETSGLGDISVAPRRFKAYGSPNRIYEIHVHNGEVKTAIREYPDRLKDGWQDQFSLGDGSSVAMAFNGEWERYRKLFRLVTEEKPYVSWVDSSGDLWVQKWDETDTKVQLSSGVVKVWMIRAWKNTAIMYLDQGIVVAYIKTDGKVYYRNYCIQEDYSEMWEYEKELTDFTGTAVNVNLFITNDYRMGFVIEDSFGQVHWLVTPRNWGGMASPADHITTTIKDFTLELTTITYYDANHIEYLGVSVSDFDVQICPASFNIADVVVTYAKRTGTRTLTVTFSHSLLNVDTNIAAFSITNYTIADIVYSVVTKTFIVTTTTDLPSVGVYTVIYTPGDIRVAVAPVCTPLLGALNFLAMGDPPVHVETIATSITNITITTTPINYLVGYGSDSMMVSISNLTVVVTKVGANPL